MKENLFNEHISKKYNDELSTLLDRVIQMGADVEHQLENALNSLFEDDMELAKKVIANDKNINQLELKIHEQCVDTLARRQPTASDLRLVIVILKSISDLERIGDLAKKIAKNKTRLDNNEKPEIGDLKLIATLTQTSLRVSLDAFARLNPTLALDTISNDISINDENESLYRQLLTHMMENPRTITKSLQINVIAQSLERIGDHAKNICEYVIYLVNGEDIRYQDLDVIRERMNPKSK